MISTSEIKVSVLIDEAYTELAVRALHSAYGLDAPEMMANGTLAGSRSRPAVAAGPRFSRLPLCNHGRRDVVGFGAASGGGDLQRRRIRGYRLRLAEPKQARRTRSPRKAADRIRSASI